MRIRNNIVSFFIVGFWGLMMGFLVVKEFLPENIQPQKIRFPKELPYIKNWGIYAKKGRMGYLKTELKKQQEGYLLKNETEINYSTDFSMYINGTAVFGEDEILKDFHIDIKYGDMVMDLKGAIKGGLLKLLAKTGYGESEFTIPWFASSDIMSNGMIPWFYISNLKVGDKFQWYILNPLTQTKDLAKIVVRRASFYYNKLSRQIVKSEFISVMVAEMYYQNIRFEFWVDGEGNPLKIVTPWGWELEAE